MGDDRRNPRLFRSGDRAKLSKRSVQRAKVLEETADNKEWTSRGAPGSERDCEEIGIMVGIQGIGGVPDPNRPDRPANLRDKNVQDASRTSGGGDDVVISNSAQAAANVANAINQLDDVPDVRADRVEAARQAIERGDHRDPEIVARVAERVSRLL